ncbi:MAG: TetR/AcrR family transcriptional regulator, partial [Thermoanaerobaculia bacterium]|nr:TetR/AcrR family transcriptional regulator [Thermoanaerobaculia bacterium]
MHLAQTTAQPAADPAIEPAPDVRERLLDVAERLFAEQGFRAA